VAFFLTDVLSLSVPYNKEYPDVLYYAIVIVIRKEKLWFRICCSFNDAISTSDYKPQMMDRLEQIRSTIFV